MPKTLRIRCIRSIWSPFRLAYLLSICGNTSNLPKAYVNSKFDILSFAIDSWRIVLAFVRSVQNKCKCIYWPPFVSDPCEIRSTTSTPPFVWSYNVLCLASFVHLLWLSLHHARSFCQTSSNQCTIQEEFFHHCQRRGEQTFLLCFLNFLFLLVYLYDLIPLCQLLVILFSNAHCAIVTGVKYRSIDMLDLSMEL